MKLWHRSDPDPYNHLARGQRLDSDTSRAGVLDDGNVAWPERIQQARQQWQQADPADFEKISKRRYRDKATGREYRQPGGAPLLSLGAENNRAISCFFVGPDGHLVFLQPSDWPESLTVAHGQVTARQLTGAPALDDSMRIH